MPLASASIKSPIASNREGEKGRKGSSFFIFYFPFSIFHLLIEENHSMADGQYQMANIKWQIKNRK
jgi:hypothetical protein